jgi:hypothetical protein
MPEDKKAAGQTPCEDTNESMVTGKAAPPRAPKQDVLPGILGKQLKAAYGELLNTPIPEAFTDLIKRLEDAEPKVRPADPAKPRAEESDP